ncbi:MAG: SMP-30/gluconolactonase/LRE family protein [Candidatus Kapaibacterium sp.]|nr:MAG: SMP-30/gluconolactonase/LRE family protein [Candidatus Kapabacteria bacterium]
MTNAALFLASTFFFFLKFPQQPELFLTRDLTREQAFTRNCEGPVLDARGRLFVVNLEQDGTIGCVSENGETQVFVRLPEGSVGNSLRFDTRGALYVADFKAHNVLRVDTTTKNVSIYAHSEEFNQPNDLCIRKNGQLFASDPNWRDSTGKLWRIDPETKGSQGSSNLASGNISGKAVLLEQNMGTTNGLTLSPDDRTLYVNESLQRKIWKYRVDTRGNISQKQLFTQFTDFGLDGMKCDKAGNLYVTRYGKGVIAVFSPRGVLVREIALKGKDCSNCTFGGKDGKTLYVTLQDRKCVEMVRVNIAGDQ